jgi:DNA segregation ATPase FtsK/SpoIIIE-like protein
MIKGQSAYWCFGLASAHDARWGLSEKQQEAGASPELWGSDQPGMSYLHAPGIDKARIAMPLRTFDWAEDTDAIRAHCAHYPASAKTVDAISASLVRLPGGQEPDITTPEPSADLRADEDDHELLLQAAELVITTQRASRQMIGRKLRIPAAQADRILHELARHEIVGPDQGDSGTCPVLVEPAAAEEVLTILRGQDPADSHQTPDPDPSVRAELDDEITDPPDDRQFTFGAPEGKKMLPAAAKKVLLAQIETWRAEADRERFATRDLKPVWTRTGLSRAWVQARLKELVKEGALGYDDAAQEFLIHPSA